MYGQERFFFLNNFYGSIIMIYPWEADSSPALRRDENFMLSNAVQPYAPSFRHIFGNAVPLFTAALPLPPKHNTHAQNQCCVISVTLKMHDKCKNGTKLSSAVWGGNCEVVQKVNTPSTNSFISPIQIQMCLCNIVIFHNSKCPWSWLSPHNCIHS